MVASSSSVSFFFDPRCPWTWLTSRWLVDVASRRNLTIHWRAFSLSLVNSDDDESLDATDLTDAGDRVLAVIESLANDGRHAGAGRFYTEIGQRTFLSGAELDDSVLASAAQAAGVDDATARADNDDNRHLMRSAFKEIRALVGADVGSPSLRLDDQGVAAYGPIVNPAPSTPDEADRIFDTVTELVVSPSFFELKRSRDSGPDFG